MILNLKGQQGIIKIFYKVYNKLGYGFLEKNYGNAMMKELKKAGMATFFLVLFIKQYIKK